MMVLLSHRGIVNCYGAFQTYYKTDLLRDNSQSAISWIGSMQAFLLIFIGVCTGPAFDAGFFRPMIFTGTFLMVFGTMMMSIWSSYWHLLLAQALCVGLGAGCLFVPGVAIVSTYFSRKSSFATGIATSGSSLGVLSLTANFDPPSLIDILGGIVYTFVFNSLEPKIGFSWTCRVLAFLMLATLSISLVTMRVRLLPLQRRHILDISAFKQLPFTLYSVGLLFAFMGMYIPFFYIQNYAISREVMSADLASYLLIILNAGSLIGRIIPNFFADKTGPLNMLVLCSSVAATLAFCWIANTPTARLFVLCLFYGFFSGAFVSLSPTTVVSLSPNLGVVGVRMGMVFVFAAVGLLMGNPIAGAILKVHGWVGLQVFCGVMVAAATTCIVGARISKVGYLFMVKA